MDNKLFAIHEYLKKHNYTFLAKGKYQGEMYGIIHCPVCGHLCWTSAHGRQRLIPDWKTMDKKTLEANKLKLEIEIDELHRLFDKWHEFDPLGTTI